MKQQKCDEKISCVFIAEATTMYIEPQQKITKIESLFSYSHAYCIHRIRTFRMLSRWRY